MVSEQEMQERWLENERGQLTSEIARGLRRVGYATLALFVGMAAIVFIGIYIRSRDLQGQVRDNRNLIEQLRKQTTVLCERGHLLIDLTEGALILVGQRLEADVKRGEAAAVKADQEFLKKFIANREKLVREQTDPRSPCAG
jgi:hypothetical protein